MSNDTVWGRMRSDKLRLVLGAATVILAVATTSLIVLNVVNYNVAVAAQSERDEYADEIERLTDEVDDLTAENRLHKHNLDRMRPAYLAAKELERRESIVESREAEVATKEADVAARESAVQSREDEAAAVSARNTDWWVGPVRECLARPGEYRWANVREGGGLGNDVSCYTN